MGVYEIGVIIYLLLTLLALVDASIGKFSRWYYQILWLFVLFVVPFGNLAYLLFGYRQVVRGGLAILPGRNSQTKNQEAQP